MLLLFASVANVITVTECFFVSGQRWLIVCRMWNFWQSSMECGWLSRCASHGYSIPFSFCHVTMCNTFLLFLFFLYQWQTFNDLTVTVMLGYFWVLVCVDYSSNVGVCVDYISNVGVCWLQQCQCVLTTAIMSVCVDYSSNVGVCVDYSSNVGVCWLQQ